MQTPKPKEKIEELNFDGTTSRIYTYLGRVYVCNQDDFKREDYTLDYGSDDWLIAYMQPHECSDMNDEVKHNYIGKQMLVRTDAILRRLLQLPSNATNQDYAIAVSASPTARAWAVGLRKARNSVDWWFANGCPAEDKELQKVIEWSEQEGWSDEVIASRSTATHILRVRRKATEMETSSETR